MTSMTDPMFHPIPEILEEIREGRLVIVVDDDDRENEGDLVMAATFTTPDHVNFMATHLLFGGGRTVGIQNTKPCRRH